jgi:hypothetical protein
MADKTLDKNSLERFIGEPDDFIFEDEEEGTSPELEIDPRKNSLLKNKILNGQEDVWLVYIQAYDQAKKEGSFLPHTQAMLAVREKFTETPTGWIRKNT